MAVPVLLVVLSILGIAVSYFNGNDAALNANISAAIAWLVIATDEVVTFLREKNSHF